MNTPQFIISTDTMQWLKRPNPIDQFSNIPNRIRYLQQAGVTNFQVNIGNKGLSKQTEEELVYMPGLWESNPSLTTSPGVYFPDPLGNTLFNSLSRLVGGLDPRNVVLTPDRLTEMPPGLGSSILFRNSGPLEYSDGPGHRTDPGRFLNKLEKAPEVTGVELDVANATGSRVFEGMVKLLGSRIKQVRIGGYISGRNHLVPYSALSKEERRAQLTPVRQHLLDKDIPMVYGATVPLEYVNRGPAAVQQFLELEQRMIIGAREI